jgi:hypothetical protein
MTTPKETCPKCGSLKFQEHRNLHTNELTHITFSCESSTDDDGEPVMISRLCHARCRITELEKEVERLRDIGAVAVGIIDRVAEFDGNTDTPWFRTIIGDSINFMRSKASTLLDKGGKTE